MRAQVDRIGAALSAGRDRGNVMVRLTIAVGLTAPLWACACVLLAMEPGA